MRILIIVLFFGLATSCKPGIETLREAYAAAHMGEEVSPEHIEAYLHLANVAQQRRKWHPYAASAYLQAGLAAQMVDSIALATQAFLGYKEYANTPYRKYQSREYLSQIFRKTGLYDLAHAEAMEAIQLAPHDSLKYYGWYHAALSSYSKAIYKTAANEFAIASRYAINHDQKSAAYNYEGLAYAKMGLTEEAKKYYTQALAYCSHDPVKQSIYYHNMGELQLWEGDTARSIGLYTRALALQEIDSSTEGLAVQSRLALARVLHPAQAKPLLKINTAYMGIFASKEKIESHELLASLYANAQQYDSAYYQQQTAQSLRNLYRVDAAELSRIQYAYVVRDIVTAHHQRNTEAVQARWRAYGVGVLVGVIVILMGYHGAHRRKHRLSKRKLLRSIDSGLIAQLPADADR